MFKNPRQFQILKDLQSNASGSVHLAKALAGHVTDNVVLKRRKVHQTKRMDLELRGMEEILLPVEVGSSFPLPTTGFIHPR